MDKKNIIIAVLIILLGVSGYFIFQKNSQKDLVFENNLKCAQYIDQQNKEVERITELPINETKSISAPKIFYSSKLNTCVVAFSIRDFRENGFNSFYINDLLSNDSILFVGGEKSDTTKGSSSAQTAEVSYIKKLLELESK
jgi:hypothetical protein